MPNWYYNRMEIEGQKTEVAKAVALLIRKDDEGKEDITFDIVAPMPAALHGTVAGSGTDENWTAVHDKRDTSKFDNVRPATEEEMAEIRATGYKDWWDWQCAEWGVKWGPSNFEREDYEYGEDCVSTELKFETPWTSPDAFFAKLEERLKADAIDVEIHAYGHPEDYEEHNWGYEG